MKVNIDNSIIHVEYGQDWEAFMATDNKAWADAIKEANGKPAKQKPTPTKGMGKGKQKGFGASTH